MVVELLERWWSVLPIYPDALIAEERDTLVKQALSAVRRQMNCMDEINFF